MKWIRDRANLLLLWVRDPVGWDVTTVKTLKSATDSPESWVELRHTHTHTQTDTHSDGTVEELISASLTHQTDSCYLGAVVPARLGSGGGRSAEESSGLHLKPSPFCSRSISATAGRLSRVFPHAIEPVPCRLYTDFIAPELEGTREERRTRSEEASR